MLYHHLFAFPDRIAEDIAYFSTFHIAGSSAAYLIGNFGQICVSVFLLLGGYGTYLSCNNHADIIQSIGRKIRFLYFAYWKVFVIVIPICAIAGVSGITLDITTFLLNFTGLNITYCGEWWFFTTYLTLLIGYPVFQLLLKNSKKPVFDLAAWIFLYACGKYFLPGVSSILESRGISGGLVWNICCKMADYLPVFFIGCIFAKYDLFAKIRTTITNPYLGVVGSTVVLLLVFVMRISTGSIYDCLYTPVFVAAAYVLLSYPIFQFLYRILLKIGSESTTIWLVHSVYCYMLCQRLVFIPRYTLFIFVWLLVLSYATSVVLKKLYSNLFHAVTSLKDRRNSVC